MTAGSDRVLRIATRGSALALWQAERVAEMLASPSELVIIETRGDQDTTSPIHAIGGTGVFVKEVQEAVLRGEADLAVHSAKDLPAITMEGLILAAVPERADARDALVGSRLEKLPQGARIGTGSVRRRSQLAAIRPDLEFGELRGNIGTRLGKAADFDAIVVAAAALDRLGLGDRIAERLEPSVMLPQVAQGALAVESRLDDAEALVALAAIDDAIAHLAVKAERAFLAALGGGCDVPVGAYATIKSGGMISMQALVAQEDGSSVRRAKGVGSDPDALGRSLCALLMEDGE
ncbi:hydroxymethylbilane synthase [Actinobacteria bacterium IMCC26256]|nr:hydroxymethylbilane synthase [Actinobacteria bacterium IMCC26256]